jgi:hypothetical protein
MLRYLVNLFLAVDQVANTVLLGHPDETISSRLGRAIGQERYIWVKPLRILVDTLFFFDKDHCKNSVMPLEQQNFREMVDYELWSWCKNRH